MLWYSFQSSNFSTEVPSWNNIDFQVQRIMKLTFFPWYAVHLPVCVNCQFLSDTDFKTVKRTALFMSFSAFSLHNKSSHHIFLQILPLVNSFFLTFPVPKIFSNLNSNCSNLLDMRNLQEQVKKLKIVLIY